jgi:hypothetical protein
MNTSSFEGVAGAVVIAIAIVLAVFALKRKTPWNIPKPPQNGWSGKWVLVGMGALLLLLLMWKFPVGSPTPSGVWEFAKDYWFWTIIGLAMLFFVFVGIGKTWTEVAPATKAVQGFVGVVAITLIGALIFHGIWGEGSSSPKVARSCQPVSDNEIRRCILGEKPTVFTTERLTYSKVLNFCVVKPTGASYESKQVGPNTWEIWTTKGALPIEYKLLEGSCPDKF